MAVSESPGVTGGEAQLSESLAVLAGVLLNEQTVDAILKLLVTLACSAMAGVDGASVSLLRTRKFETPSSTSDEVSDADAVQYQSGKGPCIEASSSGQSVNIGLKDSRDRWPEFADAALVKGFRGVLSTPLAVRDKSLGSLNLYSLTQESFDPSEEAAARTFADQASVVLSNAAAFASSAILNEQLREALATRDDIGQAKGMLMVREGCTAAEAFDILRRASQHSNRKLRDVAADFVRTLGSEGRGEA
jgi:GAF domain-containing protein